MIKNWNPLGSCLVTAVLWVRALSRIRKTPEVSMSIILFRLILLVVQRFECTFVSVFLELQKNYLILILMLWLSDISCHAYLPFILFDIFSLNPHVLATVGRSHTNKVVLPVSSTVLCFVFAHTGSNNIFVNFLLYFKWHLFVSARCGLGERVHFFVIKTQVDCDYMIKIHLWNVKKDGKVLFKCLVIMLEKIIIMIFFRAWLYRTKSLT